MLSSIKSYLLSRNSWHTRRKIVVIESDDWGSIRMPSKKAFEKLNKVYKLTGCPYNRFDALEGNEDIEQLIDILYSVKDLHGHPAKMTLNNCVANPDFEQIRKDNFQSYSYELFTQTYNKYPQSDRVMDLYRTGLAHNVFQIQFHGREHVNVARWMKALQNDDRVVKDAFKVGVFSPKESEKRGYSMQYMDALDYDSQEEANLKGLIIADGLRIFEDVWGFNSKAFIAPCYRWDESVEQVLEQFNVQYIQGQFAQLHPKPEIGYTQRKIYHFTGQKNKQQQIYIVRNVQFEPSTDSSKDWVTTAMRQIKLAFLSNKPAIICSHRLNFIGRLDVSNRDKNLKLLLELLQQIILNYPEVEFISSDQLGDVIKGNK